MSTFFLMCRGKIPLQITEYRSYRRTRLIQILFLLIASVACYQRISFSTMQPESTTGGTKYDDGLLTESRVRWELKLREKGKRLDCIISTTPIIDTNGSAMSLSLSIPPTEAKQYTADNKNEQYVVHVHGLHHSGTGYLRQTLYDALNLAFATDKNVSVASIQDSLRPYRQLLKEARRDTKKTRAIYKQFHKPEDEGQHLQTVFPSFGARYKKLGTSRGLNKYTRLAYLADTCDIISNNSTYHPDNPSESDDLGQFNTFKLIGNSLLQQWSQYWDMSAKFLLQKTPTLDVLFLENTKILPTLHVIVVRHPMTSNSWK